MKILTLVLVLFLATPVIAQRVASLVDANASNGVAAFKVYHSSVYYLSTQGEVWFHLDSNHPWEHAPQYDVPFPVSEIYWWEPQFVVLNNGEFRKLDYGVTNEWLLLEPPPWDPVPEQKSTLGGVKGTYR